MSKVSETHYTITPGGALNTEMTNDILKHVVVSAGQKKRFFSKHVVLAINFSLSEMFAEKKKTHFLFCIQLFTLLRLLLAHQVKHFLMIGNILF